MLFIPLKKYLCQKVGLFLEMIEAIGIDIVSNERVKKLYEKFGDRFLRKIFTESEIKYCLSYSDPIPHLAGKFATKEAIIKALGRPRGINLKSIEVINTPQGKPIAFLSNIKDRKILISLSHEKTHTVAIAIVINS